MRSRVVITGLGPVCSAGVGIDALWQALQEGQSSISPIQNFDASGFRPKLAGEVRDVKIRDYVPKSYRKATKVMARDTELAVIAAKVAANDAGLTTRGSEESDVGFEIDPHRTGCQIGAGLIAADTEELARAVVSAEDEQGLFSMEKWGTESHGDSAMNNLPPLWLLKYLPNMLACHVTIIHGLEGPSNTIMGAEASAILSIGESARVIERGSADMCFSGGAESRINPLGLLRWDYSGRLADTKDETDSSKITKPFCDDSIGGIIGEAGGMLVLECEDHAQNRIAKTYATIAGFGSAQSTSPIFAKLQNKNTEDKIDRGLEAAIEAALRDAGTAPEEIDVIIPLGIGVLELDQLEIGALSSVFTDRINDIPLVLPTHLIGNTMAAHGGIMTALGAKCLYKQCLPKYFTLNQDKKSTTQHPTQDIPIENVLVCTSSLGGQAGALVLKR